MRCKGQPDHVFTCILLKQLSVDAPPVPCCFFDVTCHMTSNARSGLTRENKFYGQMLNVGPLVRTVLVYRLTSFANEVILTDKKMELILLPQPLTQEEMKDLR